MLQLDSIVIDLMFQASAAIDQQTLIEGLGGEEVLQSKQLLDVDRLDPRAEMELSPSMPFRRRGERRLMIIDDQVTTPRKDPQNDPLIKADLRPFTANEEVDGRHWNDLYYTITGSSALYGNINIDGVTYLGSAISASATVTSTLIDLVQLSATIECTAIVTGLYQYGDGRAYLPRLVSFGADREVISGITYLPAFTSEAYSSTFVPPELTQGIAILTGLTSWGSMFDPTVGEGYLRAFVSKGWARDETEAEILFAAEGITTLNGWFSVAEDGERLTATWYDKVLLIGSAEQLFDLIVTFTSDLQMASVWTVDRKLISAFLSSLNWDADSDPDRPCFLQYDHHYSGCG